MEIAQPKPEVSAAVGRPVVVDDQPATPSSGPDKTQGKARSPEAVVAAAKAKIVAAGSGTPAPVAAAPAAVAAATVSDALTDEAIDKAADKAAGFAGDKAAVIAPADDFAAKVAEADKAIKAGDHIAAMKALGIDLDEAVRKATGSPSMTTKEEQLAAENKKLREENDAIKAAETKRTADATARASYDATLGAIVADTAYPNISSTADAEKALAPAKAAYAVLKADLGRDLNQAEKDRLVVRYLKRYNDKAVASEQAQTAPPDNTPDIRSGVVVPAPATKRRSVAEVKADILARKKKTN